MEEAVIIDAIRTPIGRRRGALSGVHPVDLLGQVYKHLLRRNPMDPQLVDDIIVGCVSQTGEQAANIGRNAWLSAGFPESVPATTIDRQCGSSLQALHFAAQGVMAGAYDVVIAAGVESMSRVPLGSTFQGPGQPLTDDIQRRYQLVRPWFDQADGAEQIAGSYGFTRTDLDQFGYDSHQKAHAAQARGAFDGEIVPVRIAGDDGQSAKIAVDEGVRPDTSVEQMAQLRPAFPGLKLITAGNASQISDGASAVLIASRAAAERLCLTPRARFTSFAVVGVDPVTMLTGPIPATQKVLQRAGLAPRDVDLFEVNEAFASVVLAWQKEIGVPWDRVNVHGGAIALGHPLGATGTRITATLLNALEQRDGRYGVMAICEGGGMANATVIERIRP